MQPKAIIEMIQEFCNAHENASVGILPGYDFTHIVLADYNLSDSNIEFCLDKKRMSDWIQEKAKDARCLPGECDWWMLSSYMDILSYAIDAAAFLCKLKEIPGSERELAMEWYWADDQERKKPE